MEDPSSTYQHHNAPWKFWRALDAISENIWTDAARRSLHCFADLSVADYDDPLSAIEDVLSERQFGRGHWRLTWDKRLYYRAVRRFLPQGARHLLHRMSGRAKQNARFPLRWFIEDRYVQFQWSLVRVAMRTAGLSECRYVHFWPNGKRYAFVLTHDVEDEAGQRFALKIADLEERCGFRSSFNFVPEAYRLDLGIIDELRSRGFEIGVHGLNHDGQLFSSRATFSERSRRINAYLKSWNAVGFRSPFTHRNPEWMQELEIEYDCTFFDTDPFETMSGGTMSIWPFIMGRFVELPFTLPQDSTLLYNLNETTLKIWSDKLEFIRRHCGMAQTPTHPDYLRKPVGFTMYERFLESVSERADHWNVLPRDVARWWRRRADAVLSVNGTSSVVGLPEATIGKIERSEDDEGIVLHMTSDAPVGPIVDKVA